MTLLNNCCYLNNEININLTTNCWYFNIFEFTHKFYDTVIRAIKYLMDDWLYERLHLHKIRFCELYSNRAKRALYQWIGIDVPVLFQSRKMKKIIIQLNILIWFQTIWDAFPRKTKQIGNWVLIFEFFPTRSRCTNKR